MSSRIVHVKDNVEGAVYIGRSVPSLKMEESPFQNPYRIGRDMSRAQAISAYRTHIAMYSELWPMLIELRDKPLACWCRHDRDLRDPSTACHGDVLIEILEQYTDEQLRTLEWLYA